MAREIPDVRAYLLKPEEQTLEPEAKPARELFRVDEIEDDTLALRCGYLFEPNEVIRVLLERPTQPAEIYTLRYSRILERYPMFLLEFDILS